MRASALGALARIEALEPEEVSAALEDPAPEVRRRACDVVARIRTGSIGIGGIGTGGIGTGGIGTSGIGTGDIGTGGLGVQLTRALDDVAPMVVEAACYALGELYQPDEAAPPAAEVVGALALTATGHTEPLCREAAVAALGSLGCEAGLPAVIAALKDKPAIRRRAVVAMAAFDGPEVANALERATADPDWQVRQAAEDLVGQRPRPT